ncbi:hypothetical protein D3C81_850950 [compost metagenome]
MVIGVRSSWAMAACHIVRSVSICCSRAAMALKSSASSATSSGESSLTLARTPRLPSASARMLSSSELNGDRIRWARRIEAAMARVRPSSVTPSIQASSGPVGIQLSGSSVLAG